MKNLMNLKGAKILSKKEQKYINGGAAGNCMVGCRNQTLEPEGGNVVITNAPNCSSATMDYACQNQGGAVTCSCSNY